MGGDILSSVASYSLSAANSNSFGNTQPQVGSVQAAFSGPIVWLRTTVLLLVRDLSSAGPSEKGLVTDSR